MALIAHSFLKNGNFVAIKSLDPQFVEALNMWGPRGSALVAPP